MKEATGELNMTVITVVAIAAVGAFFYAFVWPSIQNSISLNTACSAAGYGEYTDTENNIHCNGGQCCIGEGTEKCRSCSDEDVSGSSSRS